MSKAMWRAAEVDGNGPPGLEGINTLGDGEEAMSAAYNKISSVHNGLKLISHAIGEMYDYLYNGFNEHELYHTIRNQFESCNILWF
jgi:hypothetical protein